MMKYQRFRKRSVAAASNVIPFPRAELPMTRQEMLAWMESMKGLLDRRMTAMEGRFETHSRWLSSDVSSVRSSAMRAAKAATAAAKATASILRAQARAKAKAKKNAKDR